MHVSMTQGSVSVVIAMTKKQAEALATILNHSGHIWPALNISEARAEKLEQTSLELWRELQDAGVDCGNFEAKR